MEEPPLHLVRAFVSVAEHQSFARAALALGMTASSVSRLVKSLEEQVGTRLINRTTRAMSLTAAGQRYFTDSSAGFETLRAAYERVRDEQDTPQGRLKLSTSISFGRSHVVPALSAFVQAYPQLELDLLMTDRYVDIVAEGVAVAIRIGRLPDSTLVARKLLDNRRILAASPQYLERHGSPAEVTDLKDRACLISTANHDGERWRLFGPSGEWTFHPRGRMRADNADAIMQFAIDGLGIGFHSEVTLAAAIQAGRLVRVLPQWSGRETGVYGVTPNRAPGAAARALIDFLAARWNAQPR
jgi:DNA-binding transcriptional LysR family regulator